MSQFGRAESRRGEAASRLDLVPAVTIITDTSEAAVNNDVAVEQTPLRAKVMQSIRDFSDQFDEVWKLSNAAETLSPEDKSTVLNLQFEVAQIANKIRNNEQELSQYDLIMDQGRLLEIQGVISPIKTNAMMAQPRNPVSHPESAAAIGYNESMSSEAVVPERSVAEATPNEEVDLAPENAVMSEPVIMTEEEKERFGKNCSELSEKFGKVVSDFGPQLDSLKSEGVEFDNALAEALITKIDAIEAHLDTQIPADSTKEVARLSNEAATMYLKNLKEMITQAEVMYYDFLDDLQARNPGEIIKLESDSESAERQALIAEQVIPQRERLASLRSRFEEQKRNIAGLADAGLVKQGGSLFKWQSGVEDYLGGRNRKKSIEVSVTNIEDAIIDQKDFASFKTLLGNKFDEVTKLMGKIDKELEAVTSAQKEKDSASETPTVEQSLVTDEAGISSDTESLSVPETTNVTVAETASEAAKEQLFQLYKSADHRALWQPDARFEKSVSQIIEDIKMCLRAVGYSSEQILKVFNTELNPILDKIQNIYQIELPDIHSSQLPNKRELIAVRRQDLGLYFTQVLEIISRHLSSDSSDLQQHTLSTQDLPLLKDEVVDPEPSDRQKISEPESPAVQVENQEKLNELQVKVAEVTALAASAQAEFEAQSGNSWVAAGLAHIQKQASEAGTVLGVFESVAQTGVDVSKEFDRAVAKIQSSLDSCNVALERLRTSVQADSADVVSGAVSKDAVDPAATQLVEQPVSESVALVDNYLDSLPVPADFDNEILYGALPKTVNEYQARVAAIAAECGRIFKLNEQSNDSAIEVIKTALAACLVVDDVHPTTKLRSLIEVAEPLIRKHRPYRKTKAELNAIRQRESDFDLYKYPTEAHDSVQNYLSKSKDFQKVKQKIWEIKQDKNKTLPDGVAEAVEKVSKLIEGDDSVEAILWKIRSNQEDQKDSSEDINQLKQKLVDLFVAMDFVGSLLVPPIAVDESPDAERLPATEKASRQREELTEIKEQILRLKEKLEADGNSLSDELEQVLGRVEQTENVSETDVNRASLDLDRRYNVIRKQWIGEPGKLDGLYFTLSPEVRLFMKGLPATPEETGVKKLEAGDEYTEALKTYRAARLRFMGGKRKTNPDEITVDGAVEVQDKGLKQQYEEKLREFYKAAGEGALNRVKNAFGLKPKLTPELEALQAEYAASRREYANTLQTILTIRGGRFADATAKETKTRMSGKFLSKELNRQKQIQAEFINRSKSEKIQKILEVMRNNKWLMRGGAVIAAGVIAGGGLAALGLGAAAFSGTAAAVGAGTAAARMASVIGLGTYLGKTVHLKHQNKVLNAKAKREEAQGNAIETFSVDTMDELEAKILLTEQEEEAALREQKVKTIAAAALPGGLVGVSSALETIDSLMSAASREMLTAPEDITPFDGNYPTMRLEKITLTGSQFSNDDIPALEQLRLKGEITLMAKSVLAAKPHLLVENIEELVMQRLESKFGQEPWWAGARIEGVDLKISRVDAAPAPAPAASAIAAEVPTPAASASPEKPTLVAEATTAEATTSAPAAETTEEATPASMLVNQVTEAAPAAQAEARFNYQVQDRDTLTKIALDKLAPKEMANLTPVQQKIAIYELMNRAANNAELRSSIGLRGDDIDKIYAGQTINLSRLQAELHKIVADGSYKSPEVPVRLANGTLNVVRLDPDVNPIQIRVEALPTPVVSIDQPLSSDVPQPMPRSASETGEMIRTVYKEVIKAPDTTKIYSGTGNYLHTPEYQTFVKSVFGNFEKFNRAVDFEVAAFERSTYGTLDRALGISVYLSPYKEFASMTMAEIDAKRVELENMKKEYDTFGGQNSPNPFGQAGQMKYETYRASIERLDQLKQQYHWTPNTRLSDLIGRVVAETRAAEIAKTIKPGLIPGAVDDNSKLLQA